MSTENLAEAFGGLMQDGQEGIASVSTGSNHPAPSSPRVVQPDPLPLRRIQALSRLTGMREETRSVDHSRELRHHPRPLLPLLRPVSRNNKNVRIMAFARVRRVLAARRGASTLSSRTSNAPNVQRVASLDQPRRVRSAGPILGRKQEELEPETVPISADDESEWVDHHSVEDGGEAVPQELPDTSVFLAASGGLIFHVPDYNVLKDAR